MHICIDWIKVAFQDFKVNIFKGQVLRMYFTSTKVLSDCRQAYIFYLTFNCLSPTPAAVCEHLINHPFAFCNTFWCLRYDFSVPDTHGSFGAELEPRYYSSTFKSRFCASSSGKRRYCNLVQIWKSGPEKGNPEPSHGISKLYLLFTLWVNGRVLPLDKVRVWMLRVRRSLAE